VTFHSLEEMRDLLGIGRLLKEEKLVDRRGKAERPTQPVLSSLCEVQSLGTEH